ncbi:MAG: hypothetical protein DMF63_01890 [Acidobacteria bacterium]|nr:MAG: hypothetical protein DMF63_01890 [Acidobacteriota bacterium]
METTTEAKKIDAGAAFRLWIGILLPPAAWLAQLQALYLSSEYGCTNSNFTRNHVVVVSALFFSIVGLSIAWLEWTRSRNASAIDDGDRHTRSRFMALIGVMTGFLFSLLIVAQWLPTLMGVPCDK